MVEQKSPPRNKTNSKSLLNENEVVDSLDEKDANFDQKVRNIDKLNLYQIFTETVKDYPGLDCLAQSTPGDINAGILPQFHYFTYKEVDKMVTKFATYLLGLNLESPDGEKIKVGIWMSTSMCMRIIMLACHKANFVIVPVYDSLGTENVECIFSKTSVSIICVDKLSYYENILKMSSVSPHLKKIIKTISHIDNSTRIENPVPEYIYYDDILSEIDTEKISKTSFPEVPISELAFLLSTSGSSGNAKCVPVIHSNINCIIKSFRKVFDSAYNKLHPASQMKSYMFLPLAHVFGMLVDYALFAMNGSIAYPSGVTQKVLKIDLEVVKPELLTCVPLIIKRAYDATMVALSKKNFLIRGIYNIASETNLFSSIAFKQIRQSMGGRLMIIACGGSSLAPELYQFAKRVLGVKFVQGYGLTEGLISVQKYDNFTCDLGPAFDFVETKLIDVPEMNYFVNQNQGELCVKGASIFSGYYKDKEATKEAFDSDGYFRTGDIVQINLIKKDRSNVEVDRVLKYIDRRKNIFKLIYGEYVAPSEIEALYALSDTCSAYFLYGDQNRSFCVAIGFIDATSLKTIAKNLQVSLKSDLSEEQIIDEIRPKLIKKLNEQVNGVISYKKAKAWYFTTDIPTVENGLLTPTQKMKRFLIYGKYKNIIEELCKEVEAPYMK